MELRVRSWAEVFRSYDMFVWEWFCKTSISGLAAAFASGKVLTVINGLDAVRVSVCIWRDLAYRIGAARRLTDGFMRYSPQSAGHFARYFAKAPAFYLQPDGDFPGSKRFPCPVAVAHH